MVYLVDVFCGNDRITSIFVPADNENVLQSNCWNILRKNNIVDTSVLQTDISVSVLRQYAGEL